MGWLILIGVIVVIIFAVINANEQFKARKALEASFNGTHAGWETYVSGGNNTLISVSPDGSEVALGAATLPTLYSIRDVATVEIVRDGTTLTQTNRGSQAAGALIGGLALGGAGLLLGGLSGSKRNSNRINSIVLKIIVDDRSTPVYNIEFFKHGGKNGVESTSVIVKEPINRVEKFHALLLTAMRRANSPPEQLAEATPRLTSQADEVKKLWDLKLAGALTEEEFLAHKAKLLGNQ